MEYKKEIYKTIIEKFDKGTSNIKIAKQTGYSPSGIRIILKKFNRKPLQSKDKVIRDWLFIKKKNSFFFYWLGWMLSDGCITCIVRDGKQRGIRVRLGIHKNDIHIVKFFTKAIQPFAKVSIYKNIVTSCWSLPREYLDTLYSWGFIQNKTYNFKVTDKLRSLTDKQFYQFLVGYIEGDGSLAIKTMKSKKYFYKMHNVNVTGHPKLLPLINDYLVKLGYKNRVISKRKDSFAVSYTVAGSEAVTLINRLLKCRFHLLNRKWDKVA